MYICICNALREKQVQSAIRDGACTADETFRRLGCQPVCGQCVKVIEDSIAPASITNNLVDSAR